VNVENIKLVRDHIASLPPERFNMQCYVGLRGDDDEDGPSIRDFEPEGATNLTALEGSCGTCACIAGWTLALLNPDDPQSERPIMDAGMALGLDETAAARLFEPNNHDPGFRNLLFFVRQDEAVAVLDHLIATGEVDWSVTRGEPEGAPVSQQPGG
jgi:hypothetical protein